MNGLKVAEKEYIHWLIATPKCAVDSDERLGGAGGISHHLNGQGIRGDAAQVGGLGERLQGRGQAGR